MSAGRVRRTAMSALLSLLALVAAATAGCSGDSSSGPSGPSGSPTAVAARPGPSLAEVDTTGLVVARAPFCERVDPAAVTAALGRTAADAATYRSGQRTRVAGDLTDVVHEFGCTWTARGVTARAWVFAPPIPRPRAKILVRGQRGVAGCAVETGAPAFGQPSVATRCRADGSDEVGYRGLFGDAWLACTLTSRSGGPSAGDLADRADRWCAAVAIAASSG